MRKTAAESSSFKDATQCAVDFSGFQAVGHVMSCGLFLAGLFVHAL